MNAIEAINNLDYNVYKDLWAKFWIQKIGYNPAERKMTGSKMTLAQARKEDEELEKEFVEFYTNNVSNEN